jgi:ketosteroid isomerase-like protein
MIAALLLAAAAQAQPPAADPAVAEITRLEQQWGEAFVKRDFAAIERLVAPEYRLVIAQDNRRHSVTPRAEWMTNARQFRYESFSAETVDVTRVGDTAVASVRIANRVAQRPGEAFSPRASFVTDTWVRRNGRWQVIHRYSHRMTPAAALLAK